jgi:hypothetical protein
MYGGSAHRKASVCTGEHSVERSGQTHAFSGIQTLYPTIKAAKTSRPLWSAEQRRDWSQLRKPGAHEAWRQWIMPNWI